MKKLIGMIMAIAMTFALATTAFAADPSTTTTTSGSKVFVTTEPVGKDETKFDKDNGNTIGIDIPANFVVGTNDPYKVEANYYVIVKYEVEPKLVFTVGETAYTWNVNETGGAVSSANHQLKSSYDGTWSGTATVNVTVENWSNRDMQAAMTFASNATVATPDNDNGVLKAITVKNEAQSFAAAAGNDTTKTKWIEANHALNLQSAAAGVGFEEGNKANSPVSGSATFTIDATNNGMTGAISKSKAVIGTLTVKLTSLGDTNNFPQP